MPSLESKKCPFCAEEIKYEARFCRHCQKDLEQVGSEKTAKPLLLSILVFGLTVCAILLVFSNRGSKFPQARNVEVSIGLTDSFNGAISEKVSPMGTDKILMRFCSQAKRNEIFDLYNPTFLVDGQMNYDILFDTLSDLSVDFYPISIYSSENELIGYSENGSFISNGDTCSIIHKFSQVEMNGKPFTLDLSKFGKDKKVFDYTDAEPIKIDVRLGSVKIE